MALPPGTKAKTKRLVNRLHSLFQILEDQGFERVHSLAMRRRTYDLDITIRWSGGRLVWDIFALNPRKTLTNSEPYLNANEHLPEDLRSELVFFLDILS